MGDGRRGMEHAVGRMLRAPLLTARLLPLSGWGPHHPPALLSLWPFLAGFCFGLAKQPRVRRLLTL